MADRVTYAQNKEDLILKGFLKNVKNGFYVDVGANHHIDDSVTHLFYEEGWRGINIEPIPRLYRGLQAARKRDVNLNIGIASKPGELTLTEYGSHGRSTFSKETKKAYAKTQKIKKEYAIPTTTLEAVLEEYAEDRIHFMKVDVEGFEHEVLKSNDWKRFRPQVLCVEADHVTVDWRPLLKKHGYKQAFFDGLNEYYVDDSAGLPEFDYGRDVLEESRVISSSVADEFVARDKVVTKLNARINSWKEKVAFLKDEIKELEIVNDQLKNPDTRTYMGITKRYMKKQTGRDT